MENINRSQQLENDSNRQQENEQNTLATEPEYSFTGYTIELNEKVMLIPSVSTDSPN